MSSPTQRDSNTTQRAHRQVHVAYATRTCPALVCLLIALSVLFASVQARAETARVAVLYFSVAETMDAGGRCDWAKGGMADLLQNPIAATETGVARPRLDSFRPQGATAGERRVHRAGIEALLYGEDPSAKDILPRLRKHMDLPADDTDANALIESNLGRWRWNAETGKFVVEQPIPQAEKRR
jgi:hypothetical protein